MKAAGLKRYYLVLKKDPVGNEEPVGFVEAGTKAGAIGHVVRTTYSARVATQRDLIELLPNLGCEAAGEEV